MCLSLIIPVLNEVQTISLILFFGTILLALETVGSCCPAGTCETAASRNGSRFEEKIPSHHVLAGERHSAHR
jgi:hypothetical protein